MPERFYFDETEASAVNPAFDTGWEQTGEADRRRTPLKSKHTPSTLTNKVVTVPITTTQQILVRQFVSDPLPYGVLITGTVSFVIRVLESANSANAKLCFSLRVCVQDGTSFRGTLFALTGNVGTEYVTTAATRIFTAQALTPLVALAGDRLVMEVGVHTQAPTAAQTATHRHGTNAASDFALTTALTTDLNPWWELSESIFGPGLPQNYQSVKVGTGMSTGDRIR